MTPNLLDELVPRAWMLRIGDSDVWSYCEQEWMADFYGRKSGTKYEKKPLYDATTLADMAKRLEAAERDSKRLDWLADPANLVGNVQLPASSVTANLHSLRAAIDHAMNLCMESDE